MIDTSSWFITCSVITVDSKSITDIILPVLHKIWQMEEAVPFKTSVESADTNVDLSVPPTDLSDVEKRLTLNLYVEPWKFVSDVWMLFENAWLYNKKSSKVYQYCSKVLYISVGFRLDSLLSLVYIIME